jgi:hypothetical protein
MFLSLFTFSPAREYSCYLEGFSVVGAFGTDVVHVTSVTAYTSQASQIQLRRLANIDRKCSICNVTIIYIHPGTSHNVNVQIQLPFDRKSWKGRIVEVCGGGYSTEQFDSDTMAFLVSRNFAAATTKLDITVVTQ